MKLLIEEFVSDSGIRLNNMRLFMVIALIVLTLILFKS